MGQLRQQKRRLNVEGRSLVRTAGGSVGGGGEEIFDPASILHRRLRGLNHRVGVRARCIGPKSRMSPFLFPHCTDDLVNAVVIAVKSGMLLPQPQSKKTRTRSPS